MPLENTNQNNARQVLRKTLRAQRAVLSQHTCAQAAEQLQHRCLPLISSARTVAGYFAINGEMPVDELLKTCRRSGQVTLAPAIDGNRLAFIPFDDDTPMVVGQLGIHQPDVPRVHWLTPAMIDAVLVPLVGFDENCNRLGMGGGYYDQSFALRRESPAPPLLIGVAHAIQQVDSVFHEWWDVPLDYLVTDQAIFTRKP
jgi:5-formyltetrahydrofolate cyclo-ligase